MSIIDTLMHSLTDHLTRATREGRTVEAHVIALVKEIVMTSVQDLQSQINGLSDKMSQLEADTAALIAKAGGSAAAAASGLTVTQDQLDSMGNAVTSLGQRIDTLAGNVVSGTATPAAAAPSTGSATTPAASSPPAADASAPAAPVASTSTPAASPAASASVAAAPIVSTPSTPSAAAPAATPSASGS